MKHQKYKWTSWALKRAARKTTKLLLHLILWKLFSWVLFIRENKTAGNLIKQVLSKIVQKFQKIYIFSLWSLNNSWLPIYILKMGFMVRKFLPSTQIWFNVFMPFQFIYNTATHEIRRRLQSYISSLWCGSCLIFGEVW